MRYKLPSRGCIGEYQMKPQIQTQKAEFANRCRARLIGEDQAFLPYMRETKIISSYENSDFGSGLSRRNQFSSPRIHLFQNTQTTSSTSAKMIIRKEHAIRSLVVADRAYILSGNECSQTDQIHIALSHVVRQWFTPHGLSLDKQKGRQRNHDSRTDPSSSSTGFSITSLDSIMMH